MGSHQLDPRSMEDAQEVSNFHPGLQPQYVQKEESGWVGWVQFGGVMLIMSGVFHVIEGLVALLHDDVFVITRARLTLDVCYSSWGWIHLITGTALILVGAGLLTGRMLARILGVALAFLSAVLNLAFLPAYPAWSVMMIAIDIL